MPQKLLAAIDSFTKSFLSECYGEAQELNNKSSIRAAFEKSSSTKPILITTEQLIGQEISDLANSMKMKLRIVPFGQGAGSIMEA